MKKTPKGTSVGVTDPYDHAGLCDFLTSDGRCRYAAEYYGNDPAFADERRADDYRCPAADPDGAWDWRDCPHFRSTATERECARCGLEAKPMPGDERPLLEEHHLAYPDERDLGHEITVVLCRWCHAKVHDSWASVDDDANPDPEAVAVLEGRRSREQAELGFETASERFERDDDGSETT